MLDTISGRKMLASVGILLLVIPVVLIKGELPPNLVSLLEFLFGTFVAGNAVEHVTKTIQERKAPGLPAGEAVEKLDTIKSAVETLPDHSMDLENLNNSIRALNDNMTAIANSVALVQQTLMLIITRTGIDKLPDQRA